MMISGYGDGLTGPTTPNVTGVTVRGYLDYWPITDGEGNTLAVCIDQAGEPTGKEIADEIVAAVAMVRRMKAYAAEHTHIRDLLWQFENHEGIFA